ncbi:SGNH/GDSL hydrolase family protein [Nitrospirota bacterium]
MATKRTKTKAPQKSRFGIKTNIALLVASLIIALLGAEIALRARAYKMESAGYLELRDEWIKILEGDKAPPNATPLARLVRKSDHENIIFDLRPNKAIKHDGVMVRVNQAGFRDRDYEKAKPEGTVRIFGIGDSFMFGQGVEQEKNYLALLEEMLNTKYPRKRWEVLNSGVPGYNIAMEVETLQRKGLAYKPDIVILGYISNDMELPSIARVIGLPARDKLRGRHAFSTKSYLASFVKHKMDFIVNDLPPIEHKYAWMTGVRSLDASFKRLKSMANENHFTVVALFTELGGGPRITPVKKTARGWGFTVVSADMAITKHMNSAGIKEYTGSTLTVADGHPSALTHDIIARELLVSLEQKGIIDKFLK